MLSGMAYSLEKFGDDNPSYDELCEHLCNNHGVGRGIQRGRSESPTQYAQAMKSLLYHGSIGSFDEEFDAKIRSHLEESHRLGFVDLDHDNPDYIFPSPVHKQLWSWLLLPETDHPLPFQDLLSFVKATVARFRPSQLHPSDRRLGNISHRPPEAQYQDECYRCVHDLTQGNVRISAEFAAAAGSRPGRIDFFIPSKKWGIELCRDGNKLDEHNARFAEDGAYEQWMESSGISDYILLDFCSIKPTRTYPGKREVEISLG